MRRSEWKNLVLVALFAFGHSTPVLGGKPEVCRQALALYELSKHADTPFFQKLKQHLREIGSRGKEQHQAKQLVFGGIQRVAENHRTLQEQLRSWKANQEQIKDLENQIRALREKAAPDMRRIAGAYSTDQSLWRLSMTFKNSFEGRYRPQREMDYLYSQWEVIYGVGYKEMRLQEQLDGLRASAQGSLDQLRSWGADYEQGLDYWLAQNPPRSNEGLIAYIDRVATAASEAPVVPAPKPLDQMSVHELREQFPGAWDRYRQKYPKPTKEASELDAEYEDLKRRSQNWHTDRVRGEGTLTGDVPQGFSEETLRDLKVALQKAQVEFSAKRTKWQYDSERVEEFKARIALLERAKEILKEKQSVTPGFAEFLKADADTQLQLEIARYEAPVPRMDYGPAVRQIILGLTRQDSRVPAWIAAEMRSYDPERFEELYWFLVH